MPRSRWSSPLRRVLVQGPSMAPLLRDGDQLVAWLARRPRPQVGDVVLVDLPTGNVGIKRLVAVHPDGTLWVEGDNPFGSTDSRQFGAVAAGALRGRVLGRLWPRPRMLVMRRSPSGPGAA